MSFNKNEIMYWLLSIHQPKMAISLFHINSLRLRLESEGLDEAVSQLDEEVESWKTSVILITDYSPKSIAVIGCGLKENEDLKEELGGIYVKYNGGLKCGPGFVGSKKRHEEVLSILDDHGFEVRQTSFDELNSTAKPKKVVKKKITKKTVKKTKRQVTESGSSVVESSVVESDSVAESSSGGAAKPKRYKSPAKKKKVTKWYSERTVKRVKFAQVIVDGDAIFFGKIVNGKPKMLVSADYRKLKGKTTLLSEHIEELETRGNSNLVHHLKDFVPDVEESS